MGDSSAETINCCQQAESLIEEAYAMELGSTLANNRIKSSPDGSRCGGSIIRGFSRPPKLSLAAAARSLISAL